MLLFICLHLKMVEVGGQQPPLYFVMFMLYEMSRTHHTPHVVCCNTKQGKGIIALFTSFFLGTKSTHVIFVIVFLATTSLVARPFCPSTCNKQIQGANKSPCVFFLHVTTNVENSNTPSRYFYFIL